VELPLTEFVEPDVSGQGETLVPGTETPWLSPGIARLVAPSGTLDAPELLPVKPGVVGFDAVSDEVAAPCVLQLDVSTPPPSNAPLEDVVEQVTMGLTPGTFSSVAPSGIVLESADDMADDVEPRGDVAPIADVELL
jgi:hypothetical protein